MKPIDQLRTADLEGRPFWRFAEHAEGLPDQDETSVEPAAPEELHLAEPLFVVADFAAHDGTCLVGLVQVSLRRPREISPCAIITDSAYAPLPSCGGQIADGLRQYSEKLLGYELRAKMPMVYTLRARLAGDTRPLSGTYDIVPATDA